VNYIPVITNSEIATNNREYLVPSRESEYIRTNKTNYNAVNNKSNDVNMHNVKILGDSQLWGSSIRIREYLVDKFEVCGMIKLGASAADIVAKLLRNIRT
jgi:hypothetical protein